MPCSNQLMSVGRMLRELADTQPENASALRIWSVRAREVERFITATPELSDAIPHVVWHFLSDADIRLKDVAYREAQLAELAPILTVLEDGGTPVDAA